MLAKYVMSSEYLLNARASDLYDYIERPAMNDENETVIIY